MSRESFWENLPIDLPQETHKYHYRLTSISFQQVDISRERIDGKDKEQITGSIKIIPLLMVDSIVLQWTCSSPSSLDPFQRITQYQAAKDLKKEMMEVLDALGIYFGNGKNVYGIAVKQGVLTDTSMVVTKWKSEAYPTTSEIYGKIGMLRTYAAAQGAKVTGYPMLNAAAGKNGGYEVMVAVTVNRLLAGNALISAQKFVSWKTFEGAIKGGAATAELALAQIRQFTKDYGHTAMAIPFQSLVTERDQELDTLKWVTRVVELVN
jgi:hypothetical protein